MKKIINAVILLTLTASMVSAQEEKLQIEGAIQIGNSEDPSPAPGTIRWNGLNFEGWNGTFWVPLSNIRIESIITDLEGHEYRTVQIGTQHWMVDNLRTTKFVNNDDIPEVSNDGAWASLTTPGFCWYNNDSMTYEQPYGKLYNWSAAVDWRNICPAGWHLPSNGEWTLLASYLGGHLDAGGKMKEVGTRHWLSPNTDATNDSGFTGHPGGLRLSFATFDQSTYAGYWWSSTQFDTYNALAVQLTHDQASLGVLPNGFRNGLSIRCLKN